MTLLQMFGAAVVALLVLAVVVLWLSRRGARHDPSRDVERFAAARAVTSRWASDPASAPKPVRDIAARNARPVDDDVPEP